MWQNILTGLIIVSVTGMAVYRLIRFFRRPPGGCAGCSQSCGSCSLEELKRDIASGQGMKPGSGTGQGNRKTTFLSPTHSRSPK